jgi:hypothetical protein
LTIDSSGRVGIGISTPGSELEVSGGTTTDGPGAELRLSSKDQTIGGANEVIGSITFKNNDASGGMAGVMAKIDAASNRIFDGDNASGMNLRFFAGDKGDGVGTPPERMRISTEGHVGIGTTIGARPLVVSKGEAEGIEFGPGESANVNLTLHFNRDSSVYTTNEIRASDHTFYIGSSEKVRIDTNGYLGVNSITPSNFGRFVARNTDNRYTAVSDAGYLQARFDDNSSAVYPITIRNTGMASVGHAAHLRFFLGRSGTNYNAGLIGATSQNDYNSDATADAALTFQVAQNNIHTERMRISSNGDIYFGNDRDADPWNRSTGNGTMSWIEDSGAGTAGCLAIANNADRSFSAVYINKFAWNGGDDARFMDFRVNGGSSVGTITYNNSTSGTNYNTTSDYRLKENVVAITDGIERLKQLNASRFNFIGNTAVVNGFIAHEVQDVVPEAVTGEKDAVDADGNPRYQSIDQSKLVPLLTAALQEAIGKIETLETANASLEARLTALEGA